MTMINMELRASLTEDFNLIKSELKAVRAEPTSTAAGFRAKLDQVKSAASEADHDLSSHSDELEKLRGMMVELKTEVSGL